MTTMTANTQSWIESANAPGNDFPIQNLPLGIFRRNGSTDDPRIGVAIGDQVLDVRACVEAGIISDLAPEAACALCATTLNAFMAQGRTSWTGTRSALTTLLATDTPELRDDPALASRRARTPAISLVTPVAVSLWQARTARISWWSSASRTAR